MNGHDALLPMGSYQSLIGSLNDVAQDGHKKQLNSENWSERCAIWVPEMGQVSNWMIWVLDSMGKIG